MAIPGGDVALSQSGTTTSYVVIDLHPLAGFRNSLGLGISGGQQAGYGEVFPVVPGEGPHALLWTGSAASVVDLQPPGFVSTQAKGVSGGQQVGVGYGPVTGDAGHAMLWSGSAASVVDLNPVYIQGLHSLSDALGVSGGQQVGWHNGPITGGDVHAMLWSGSAASVVDLNPAGFTYSAALGISGGQQVGGGAGPPTRGDIHAMLWSGSAASVVDLHPNGFTSSYGLGISSGQQVGYGISPSTKGNSHALLWSGSAASVVDLHPRGFVSSLATGVSGGQQVGSGSPTGGNWHALLWRGSAASVVDLHQFVPSGFIASQALGIDTNGNIVGWAIGDAGPHAILWVPRKPDPLLTVPHWYQAGIPSITDPHGNTNNSTEYSETYPGNFWATDPYDDTPSNIWRKGCALTTLTILANFWANFVNDPTDFSPLDPRQINLWTGMYGNGGNVAWNNWATFPNTNLMRVYRECSELNPCNNTFPLLPSRSSPDPIQTLVNILRNGERGVPVIIPIKCGNTTNKCTVPPPGSNKPAPEVHWVVVTGVVSQDGTFVNDPATIKVNDPGDTTTKTLADVWSRSRAYNADNHITQASVQASLNNIAGWKVYSDVNTNLIKKDPNTPQALGIYTSDPVEFVLTDPQGRRTGFDPVTNTLFEEIPTSAYSTAIYGDEKDLSTPASPPFTSLDMANQTAGQYTLDVIGTGSGNFTVEVRTSDAMGNWITQTYSGTTAPGATSRVAFQSAVTTFASFSANVIINNSKNQFAVDGQFTLGRGSPGINPATEPVTLQVGAFLITIPAGSFQLDSHGNYVFQGTISGVQLVAAIRPQGGIHYAYGITGQNANNLPAANPVDVGLAIGNNGGATSVNASFVQ